MKYSTQMNAAKKGILTNQMENVLNNEDLKRKGVAGECR